MAVDIALDRLKSAVFKLAELTGENRFVLIGRATLAITAPEPFQEFARSDDWICGLKAMRMPLWTFALNKWVREVHSILKTASMSSV